jgi:serine/threonine-protein phosphatase 6 regulatory subunit 3
MLKGILSSPQTKQRQVTELIFLSSKPKGVRLGFMGHLTLISDDVISTLEGSPADLLAELKRHVPEPAWSEYVQGPFHQTKERDSVLLGGGKPALAPGYRGGPGGEFTGKWDELASKPGHTAMPSPATEGGSGSGSGGGDFHRSTTGKPTKENTADFGPSHSRQREGSDDAANVSLSMSRILWRSLTTARLTRCVVLALHGA